MRIEGRSVYATPCYNTMDGKDVNGVPVTDIGYENTSNGILSPPTTPSATTPVDNDGTTNTSGSGRFKFFKDGKFILELWHHKNGERMFWIPVTKNTTYWPPTGPCTPRQESSTSLSVSDDNSSIQSSPWQRDHCWKQSTPRKNISQQLEFSMRFTRRRRMRLSARAIRRKRRRPYDVNLATTTEEPMRDSVPTPTRKRLLDVVSRLLDRRGHDVCRTDPGIVSPRKRILKEMEKVSLEDMGNANKKHRARTVTSTSTSHNIPVGTGCASTSKPNNHSISSILSRDEEQQQQSFLRSLLKSPPSETRIESPRPPSPPLLHCPRPLPPYPYYATAYASPPISNHPPYYSAFEPTRYDGDASWAVASSLQARRHVPAPAPYSPWIPSAHSSFRSYTMTENGTDVPLNLSKH